MQCCRFLDPAEEMKEGLLSPTVKSAEEMLEAVGYDPGEVDGLFDEETEAAVKNFKKILNLNQLGF